ncbi:M14 family zinc carboxypeptidase [candidate division KSB1 bacterium]
MKRPVHIVMLSVIFFISGAAAQSWEFYPDGTYDAGITRPQDFLGYDLGERFTFHHQMIAYYETIARESDRVQFHEYGQTYEQRPLTYLIITSPENFTRLDEIRENNLKLADPRMLASSEEAERIIQSNPSVAWLGYSVHGNEACSAEAALLTVYQLAAGTDRLTLDLLQNLVVIIDPVLNPDGRDFYAFNYSHVQDKTPNPLSIAMERSASRGGRTNHYNVDLNRDWVFLTQKETKARTRLYNQWLPQVAVDFHEMGANSTYFFFPAASPINLNYPEQVKTWQRKYGEGNAAAFDRYGWEYYTHEGFDMYYPGYGDSWPSLLGATGMTYEQGGGGSAGIVLKRGENDYLSLRDRLWHHFTASIATIKVSSDNREQRLRDFHDFFATAIDEGRNGPFQEIIMPPPRNPMVFNMMLVNLLDQGIEIGRAEEGFRGRNLHGYYEDDIADRNFPEGSYLIKLDQPRKRLIKILFEPEQTLPDTFFYDLSAWAFPYATNTETYWSETRSDVAITPVTGPAELKGAVVNDPAQYAYLLPPGGTESILATYELIQQEVKGGIANREITIGGRSYKRGTAVFFVRNSITEDDNSNDVHVRVRNASEKYGVTFYGVNTGIADEGVDLGSRRITRFVKPKIGIVGGTGNIRHLFDHRYNIDFVSIDPQRLQGLDLEDVNVIIVTSNIGSQLGNESAMDGFKQWLRDGGVFVGWGGGVTFALSESAELAEFELAPEPEKDEEAKKQEEEEQKRYTVEERETSRKKFASPGYFTKVHLDTTHPLAYGVTETLPVLKFRTTAFELKAEGGIVGIFDKNPKLSGYAYPDNTARIADKGYLAHSSMNQGHVILFSDNPTYREFLTGIEPLFLNAVLLMLSQ